MNKPPTPAQWEAALRQYPNADQALELAWKRQPRNLLAYLHVVQRLVRINQQRQERRRVMKLASQSFPSMTPPLQLTRMEALEQWEGWTSRHSAPAITRRFPIARSERALFLLLPWRRAIWYAVGSKKG